MLFHCKLLLHRFCLTLSFAHSLLSVSSRTLAMWPVPKTCRRTSSKPRPNSSVSNETNGSHDLYTNLYTNSNPNYKEFWFNLDLSKWCKNSLQTALPLKLFKLKLKSQFASRWRWLQRKKVVPVVQQGFLSTRCLTSTNYAVNDTDICGENWAHSQEVMDLEWCCTDVDPTLPNLRATFACLPWEAHPTSSTAFQRSCFTNEALNAHVSWSTFRPFMAFCQNLQNGAPMHRL